MRTEMTRRPLLLTALALWIGYHLRVWVECGSWVRTEQGMQCRGKA